MSASILVRRFPLARRLSKILIVIFTLTIFAGMVVIPFEMQADNTTINTVVDGLWWAITTVTTVGYGDLVPVTTGGRVIGAFLQISGAVMFGTLVGTITVYLNQVQEDYEWRRIHEKLDRMEDNVNTLRHKTDFLIKQKESTKAPQRWRL
ncbi:MAG: two pore domain potassium channel family protein [Candidatus Pacebacteria bacterium]|jgi:voltage-gated potassium channel|nr:two pore domain potassium channel family protein [Candidatus Paceibacterota bacterium]MBT6756294.1 two pore domain potassium channel family protein [Candidatus Paceibacterota bacterium]MBT6921585.1 two pore domain potassium channel family protein [Candidatus Paceibacterota bacterium]